MTPCVFRAEQDYQFYLHYLKEFAEQFGCTVLAYILMTNHVHLLLTPSRSEGPVPRGWPKAMRLLRSPKNG